MNKKGQIYIIDAFLAVLIIIVGVGFLVADFVSEPNNQQSILTSKDISKILFKTPLSQLSNDYIEDNAALLDFRLTPAQQVQVWLYEHNNGCGSCASNASMLISSLLADLVPIQNNFNVTLSTNKSILLAQKNDHPPSRYQIVQRAIIVSTYNQTKLLGPDIMEVYLWQ